MVVDILFIFILVNLYKLYYVKERENNVHIYMDVTNILIGHKHKIV